MNAILGFHCLDYHFVLALILPTESYPDGMLADVVVWGRWYFCGMTDLASAWLACFPSLTDEETKEGRHRCYEPKPKSFL